MMDTTSLFQSEFQSNNEYLEIFSLIWLDSDVDSLVNKSTQKKLRSSLNYIKKFDDENECEQYIEQQSINDRLVIIVSGRFGRELVPKIHELTQVSSIYVYCMNKEANELWANKFSKIRDVIVDSDELISKIETDQKIQMKIDKPLSINIFTKNTNNQFVYFQLFIHCFIKMKFNENDKNELISLLEKEYQDNDNQLNIVHQFRDEYLSEKVLWWYTRQSFFDRVLDKALHIQNIHRIFLFHSYISHLYFQLKSHQPNDRLQVFRSQLLSNNQLDNLKENLGQFISINSFLSTNTDRSKALADFDDLEVSTNLQRVLFEIDADPLLSNAKPFAFIHSQNNSVDTSEVLFMVTSVFNLTDITHDDNELWIVKMTLCTDEEYNSILNSVQIKPQNENEPSNLRTLAKILWKMGKLDLAEFYYERFIDELSLNDPLLINIYDDLGQMALQKKNYDSSLQWYRKLIDIKKQNSTTNDTDTKESTTFLDYFPDLGYKNSRPVCWKHDSCDQLNDEAHMLVFFHRILCQFGGQCELIDNEEHKKLYTHPEFCIDEGSCIDMNESHLINYCHVSLCKDGLKCTLLIKYDSTHCKTYRHCKNNCQFNLYCYKFHNNEHIEDENHPFKIPCPYTPYMCHFYDKFLSENVDHTTKYDIHCFKYSHVCPYGRQCPNLSNKEHIQSHIHIIRLLCPDQDNCQLLDNENHLNSYTHLSINDIRSLCQNNRLDCPDRFNNEHIKQFRHTGHLEYIAVSRYLELNKNINFIQNQNEMIENIEKYIQISNWNPTTITISNELKKWIRSLQPIHRCNQLIFESILVHGHVMSRDHMNSLRETNSVAKAIKQHTKIKRIFNKINNTRFQHKCEEYIQILVHIQFNKNNINITKEQLSLQQIESLLKDYLTHDDIETVRKLTNEISDASFQLHSNPTGIGFGPDQNFGTNKHVFGVLGPHTGYYYGDIIIVFRQELMYHPDSNFSIQAATTFGSSKNAYKWRPWLTDPGSPETRIEHFHKNKLHCSIENYENAAAYELMALTGLKTKSTIDIDLQTIKQRWLNIDSHCVFEAHLPQLIPLDYIEKVYIAQTTFDSLSNSAQQSAKTIFADGLCITPHQIDINIKPAGLHQPLDATRVPFQSFVINDISEIIDKRSTTLPPHQGIFVTLPSSQFKEHIILPITISQSYNQYKSNKDTLTNLTNSIYIYWEAFHGDVILTLSNQIIDTNIEQNNLQCLTCYIAKWPSNNIIKNTSQTSHNYHESYSYISNHLPVKHYFVIDDQKFKSSSNTFHRGSNMDDYIMYNLIINTNTNEVTLSIVGSNHIYNQQKINYTFNQTELDLNTLEFIQLSAGSHTVPIRNFIIKHQPIEQYHPSIDFNFIQNSSLPSINKLNLKQNPYQSLSYHTSYLSTNTFEQQFSIKKKVLNLCVDSIHCLFQYADTKEGKEHNEQYTHLCRFSELCRRKSLEPHLIHIPHLVPICQNNEKCQQLDQPLHRAQFRHSKLPDYLIPCRYQQKCRTKTIEHKIKFSHGETIPLPVIKENT